MPGRPLKNYDYYLERLENYAKATGLKIEYRDYPGDGAYIPSKRKIVLDKDMPESTELATLLHELGHALDDTLYSKEMERKLDRAYQALYAKRPVNRKEHALIVANEQRAWMFARSIAKKLQIPLGRWFDKEEAEGMASYREEGQK